MVCLSSLPLALSLIPGYWISAVSAQDHYEAASRAFGPPDTLASSSASSSPPSTPSASDLGRLEDEESRPAEPLSSKEEGSTKIWPFVFASALSLLLWFFNSLDVIKNTASVIIFTIVVAVVLIVSTADIWNTRESTVCRSSEGRLFNPRTSNGGVTYPPLTSTATDYSPFSRKLQVLLVYSALTVYPLLLVLQKTSFAAPLVSIGTIGFTFIISRTVPARKRWSFRWTLAAFLVFDTILVLFPVVLSIALDAPAGLVFEIWIKERVPEEWASHTEKGAAGVERLRKGWFEERRLGAEAQIYRFFLLGVWGWVVTGLYRLDVRLRERCGKSSLEEQEGRDGEVQEAASQLESSSDSGNKIITAGTPIAIPSLRYSLHTHSHEALQSLPVYFSTSLLILVGLLLFLPLSLELVEGLEFSDGFVSTAPVSASASELLSILLAAPLTALAITILSICRREFREVWMYQETWGGLKPAPPSLEDGWEEKKGVAMDVDEDASVEALLSEKGGLLP